MQVRASWRCRYPAAGVFTVRAVVTGEGGPQEVGAAAGRTQTPTQTPTQSRLDRGQELGRGSEVTSTLAGLWELGCLRSLTFNNFHATQCSWIQALTLPD